MDDMVELKGSLGGIGLPALVQLLGELHDSGRLELWNGTWSAELAFDQGLLVDAVFGHERGLSAIAACMLTLGDAEFAFIEGAAPTERSIDLSPSVLRAHLADLASRGVPPAVIPSLEAVPRLTNANGTHSNEHIVLDRGSVQILTLVDGQRTVREIVGGHPLVPALRELALLAENGLIALDAPAEPSSAPVQLPAHEPLPPDPEALAVCPKLGFADDPTHHYSRATALHRCYASGAASVVTAQEQRELCLSGRFPDCARFRSAADGAPVPPTITASTASHIESPRLPVPPRVAARVAAFTPPPTPAEQAPSRHSRLQLATGVLLVIALILAAVAAFRSVIPRGSIAETPASNSAAFESVEPTRITAARATVALPVGGASATAAAVPTVAPRPAVAAGAASAPTGPVVPTQTPALFAGRPVLDARFSSGPPSDWPVNAPFAAWSDGAYRLQAREAAHFVAVAAPTGEDLSDVTVTATFRKTGGPPGGGYGLIVRDRGPLPRDGQNQEMNAYVVETGDLGEYGIWRRDGDHWVDLVPWTHGGSVRPGGSPNELSVKAIGAHLTFSINGIQVAAIDDDTLPSGAVGIFAGGDFNEVALDRFTVQVPD